MDEALARERPVFTVGGDVYRWDDVVRFAEHRGEWDPIVADAAAGRAAEGEAVSQAEVDGAARLFRLERRLLAADELAEWLDRRGVTVDEWLAYLRWSLARGRSPRVAEVPASVDEHDAWVEATCSGRLDELARTLARLLAVAPGVPFEGLLAAYEAFCDGTATDEAIDREIASARMDWLRVEYATALFANEEAAAEAALCVREDGDAFAAVAALAGVTIDENEAWLEEIDPVLAARLLAALPGDVVGPVETDGGTVVAELRAKRPVEPEDPVVRCRAAVSVADQAASRLATDRVIWHEHL